MKPLTSIDILREIKNQDHSELFKDLYGKLSPDSQALKRLEDLCQHSETNSTHFFSAPGRTELGGNHTDHNLGKVLCAAVQNDTLAAVSKRVDGKVVINSEGFGKQFVVDIRELKPNPGEMGETTALIRGVLAGISERGGNIGGFDAQITSNVGVGSGLSSSAAFEVLIGTIINNLYNNDLISAPEIARIGQYAENKYFGKPCGLMDQTASAVGGVLEIDFKDPESIDIKPVHYDFSTEDYTLVVVNTGSTHTDLTYAYASIPEEMRLVAGVLGVEQLRAVDEEVFLDRILSIREKLGDRAVLRALHFYRENERVNQMAAALEEDDFEVFLGLVSASGESSRSILQNAIPPHSDGTEQGLAFALGISQLFFEQKGRGVARVHGGGFAGTIQAYIHTDDFDAYHDKMSNIFGINSVQILHIRNNGARSILELN
ncbi:MAG: galactokinase [Candidatus Marinimicrobia bacterium]|nr:galactokinase [FCB group bacterium]MBL7024956.1 galactokinase [Candidatus Neomarinimicrobiota bacterium]